MSQESQNNNRQQATLGKLTSLSRIWVLPLLALIVGIWMIYEQLSTQGPMITIEVEQATGLESDKTKIKSRDVDIGIVKDIKLKDDLSGVIIYARIDKSAEHLLRKNSEFWVVKPRISFSGISGLSTLLSGPYIAMSPSDETEKQLNFVALESPPVTPAGTPGLHVTLSSAQDFSFKEGDSVVYKGLKVGEFEDVYFNLGERTVYYNVFIKDPFHKLITENTKFWNTSGLSFALEASGFTARTGSLETMLTNGVTFDVPEGMDPGAQITERSYFEIFEDYNTASEQRYKNRVRFVLMIEDTVRGLREGAPVEYRGITIGEVIEVNMAGTVESGMLSVGYRIPVLIEIQPGRLLLSDTEDGAKQLEQQFLQWIKQGMRASLKMGNLVTGSLFVDIKHYEDNAETITPYTYKDIYVIPARSNEFTQITQKVNAILDDINAVPFSSLGQKADILLTQLNETATEIKQTAVTADTLLSDVKNQKIAEQLKASLHAFESLMHDYSQGSRTHESLLSTLNELRQSLQEITPLLQQINHSPNSLIFSQGTQPKLEPKAKGQMHE